MTYPTVHSTGTQITRVQNTYSLATGARARASTGRRDGARRSLVPTSSCIRRTREAHPGRSAAVAVPGPTRAAGRLGRTGLPAPRRNRPDPERARTAVRARIHCARSVRHGRAVPDRRSTPPRPRPADGADAHFTLHTVRLVTHDRDNGVGVDCRRCAICLGTHEAPDHCNSKKYNKMHINAHGCTRMRKGKNLEKTTPLWGENNTPPPPTPE